MAQRRTTDQEVQEIILSPVAEVIEEYPTDKYSPSCLIYGVTTSRKILHVQSNREGVIVTVYDPDPEEWIALKRRKK